jgi:hypothetical protein
MTPSQGELIPRPWKRERPGYLVPRVLTGSFLGIVAGAVGGALGFLSGIKLSDCNVVDDVCDAGELFPIFAPTVLGAGALSSLGVYGMGSLLHGRGSFIATMLGGFAGAGLGLLIAPVAGYGGLLLIPPLATAGAIIAYEVSGSNWAPEEAKASRDGSGLQLIPVFGATPGGGILGGITGRF